MDKFSKVDIAGIGLSEKEVCCPKCNNFMERKIYVSNKTTKDKRIKYVCPKCNYENRG